jgi:hypothetical protein
MVEILHFKKGATIIKLNATITNLNVQGILMSNFWRDKNIAYIHLTMPCRAQNTTLQPVSTFWYNLCFFPSLPAC